MFVIGFITGVGTTFMMYMMIWQQFKDSKRRPFKTKKSKESPNEHLRKRVQNN
jgi:hypothetical protein|tara:strand:+ start:793 stop:951 length:159 start_codon:yes stop_codon:yes gene_type:complete